MIRFLVILAGGAVVAAATHANVVRAGGYASDEAPLIITIAALLALGMGYVGAAFADGRRFAAIALGACILAGEAYWVLLNTEREIAAREQAAAPAVDQVRMRQAAEKRLVDAQSAKQTADSAALSEAAKPGCRRECRLLLEGAKADALRELEHARAALAALPVSRSAAPLPERLGVAPWAWDLIMAGLRSLAVVGGSIGIGMAAHPRRPAPAAPAAPIEVLPAAAPRAVMPREHVALFLHAVLRPDPAGATSLRRLHERYSAWCSASDVAALPPDDLGRELRGVIEAIGLECEPKGRDVVVYGATVAS